jgi:hypothetical protein
MRPCRTPGIRPRTLVAFAPVKPAKLAKMCDEAVSDARYKAAYTRDFVPVNPVKPVKLAELRDDAGVGR